MKRTTIITLGVLAAAVVAVVVLKSRPPPAAPLAKGLSPLAQAAAAVAAAKASPGTGAATGTSVKPAIVAAPTGTGLARVVDMSAFASSEPVMGKAATSGSLESIFNPSKYLY